MEYYGGNDYRDYLAHHGVLGMHWGIRRYQPYSTTGPRKGGKTGKEIGLAGKISGSVKKFKANRAKAKAKRAETKAIKEQKKAAEAEERAKKEKERLLNEGSAKEVMSNYGKLSESELQYAINRLGKAKQIRELADDENLAKIERGKKYVMAATDIVKNAATMYTSLADVKKKVDELKSADKKKAEEARQKKADREADKIMAKHDTNEILKAMSEGKLNKEQGKKALEMLRNKEGIEDIQRARQKREKEAAEQAAKKAETAANAEREKARKARREESQSILDRADESRRTFKESLNQEESTAKVKKQDDWSESYRTALERATADTARDLKMPGSAATKFVRDTISAYDSSTRMTERDKDRAYVLQRNESIGKKYLDEVFSKVSGSVTNQQDEQILRTWDNSSSKSASVRSNEPKWKQRGESTSKLNYDQQYDYSYNYFKGLGMTNTGAKALAKEATRNMKKKKK